MPIQKNCQGKGYRCLTESVRRHPQFTGSATGWKWEVIWSKPSLRALQRALSTVSAPISTQDPGPPPDGGSHAWLQGILSPYFVTSDYTLSLLQSFKTISASLTQLDLPLPSTSLLHFHHTCLNPHLLVDCLKPNTPPTYLATSVPALSLI